MDKTEPRFRFFYLKFKVHGLKSMSFIVSQKIFNKKIKLV